MNFPIVQSYCGWTTDPFRIFPVLKLTEEFVKDSCTLKNYREFRNPRLTSQRKLDLHPIQCIEWMVDKPLVPLIRHLRSGVILPSLNLI